MKEPGDPISRLVNLGDLQVVVVLYVATEYARDYLAERCRTVWGAIPCIVEVVQLIPGQLRLTRDEADPLSSLIRDYYDHSVFDPHFEKGGAEDARYGFADGGLPLVLHHNTPNNSIALLWSYEDRNVRGIFPRVQRHKEAP